jgi:hypothetical protein
MITTMFDVFFKYLRSGLLAITAFVFVFAVVYVPVPVSDTQHLNVETTYAAGGGPWDLPNFLENLGGRLIQVRDFVVQNWIYIKEQVLDGVFWRLAKEFISNMVADVVDWINSGFDGSPAFVQDLGDTLLRSADVAVGEFINELGGAGSFVCSPFAFDVRLAVAVNWDLERENRIPECRLTTVITNFEDFISGDFRAGGWGGWFDLVAQPQSTPYGSIITAQNEARARVVNARGEELKLLDFGDGFFSIPFCEPVSGGAGGRDNCSIATPGNVLSNSLNKALGAGQDSLVEADEFDEVFVALLGQLTTRLVSGASGILGLSGGGAPTYTPYSRGPTDTPFTDDLRAGGCDPVTGLGCTIDDDGTGGGSTGVGSVTPGGIGNNTGLQLIEDGLAFQSPALSSLAGYITNLRNFIANPLNEDSDVYSAQAQLELALELRTRILADQAEATPIRDAYVALETEYLTADLSRRTEIRTVEQPALVQEFMSIGLLSEQEYETYTRDWDRLLARNIEPPSTPPPIEIDCDIFPSDPACLEPSGPGPIR